MCCMSRGCSHDDLDFSGLGCIPTKLLIVNNTIHVGLLLHIFFVGVYLFCSDPKFTLLLYY